MEIIKLKDNLNEVIKKEEYKDLNDNIKAQLVEMVRTDINEIIQKEINSFKTQNKILENYKKISQDFKNDFSFVEEDSNAITVNLSSESFLVKSFLKDIKISALKSINDTLDYQKLILTPKSMEDIASLMKVAGILKSGIGVLEEDLKKKNVIKP